MSSIDQDAVLSAAGSLYDALDGAWAGTAPFPLGPDPSLASYYTRRPHPYMRRADFTLASCLDEREVAARLDRYWREAGRPGLADRAGQVAKVAAALRDLYRKAAPEAEVSPYIYSMF
jgi:hypothetical protein